MALPARPGRINHTLHNRTTPSQCHTRKSATPGRARYVYEKRAKVAKDIHTYSSLALLTHTHTYLYCLSENRVYGVGVLQKRDREALLYPHAERDSTPQLFFQPPSCIFALSHFTSFCVQQQRERKFFLYTPVRLISIQPHSLYSVAFLILFINWKLYFLFQVRITIRPD